MSRNSHFWQVGLLDVVLSEYPDKSLNFRNLIFMTSSLYGSLVSTAVFDAQVFCHLFDSHCLTCSFHVFNGHAFDMHFSRVLSPMALTCTCHAFHANVFYEVISSSTYIFNRVGLSGEKSSRISML